MCGGCDCGLDDAEPTKDGNWPDIAIAQAQRIEELEARIKDLEAGHMAWKGQYDSLFEDRAAALRRQTALEDENTKLKAVATLLREYYDEDYLFIEMSHEKHTEIDQRTRDALCSVRMLEGEKDG